MGRATLGVSRAAARSALLFFFLALPLATVARATDAEPSRFWADFGLG